MKNSTIDYSDFCIVYDAIIDYDIASSDEIGVACHFNGRTTETLNELIFYKTGYHDIVDFITFEVNDREE